MTANVSIRFNFDVSQVEFTKIIKALRHAGLEEMASELETARAKQFADIVRRFSTHMSMQANEQKEES